MTTLNLLHNKFVSDPEEFIGTLDEIKTKSTVQFMLTRISGLGDTFTLLPFVRVLEANWDDVRGLVVINENLNVKPLFSQECFEVLEVKKGTGISELSQDYLRIRNFFSGQSPDLYFDLTQSIRGLYYALFSHARLKVGFKWHGFHKWILDAAIDRAQTKFETESLLDQLRLLGFEEKDVVEKKSFALPQEGRSSFQQWRKDNVGSYSKFLVLSPGASLAQKRWSPEGWSKLLEWLSDKCGYQFVLVEGPDEAGISKQITDRLSSTVRARVHPFRDRPLTEVIYLLKGSMGIISHCSAVRHIGIVLGKPTFCIFNNSDPFRYRFKSSSKHYSSFDLETAEPSQERVRSDIEPWLDQQNFLN